MFESIPMVIFQFIIINDVIPWIEFQNSGFKTSLTVSITFTFLNICFASFDIFFESKALDEPLIRFILECMQARLGWSPFIHHIKNHNMKFSIDYDQIECQFPVLSTFFGFYKQFSYQFDDNCIFQLVTELNVWKNDLDRK